MARGEAARGRAGPSAPRTRRPRAPRRAPCSPGPPRASPDDEARRALAELALVAPDDPRLEPMLRARAAADTEE